MLNTFTYQHRTSCHAIYIAHQMCRLLYFDRNGAFVSTPFDWTATTSPLHTFLWKLAHQEASQMGYDPTAIPASEDEAGRFRQMATEPSVPLEVRQYVERAISHSCPLYKLRITPSPPTADEKFPDDPDPLTPPLQEPYGGAGDHYFIVGRPHFSAESLIGRCTRGYVALQLGDKVDGSADALCFLKDCWRPYVPGRTRPEHLVYERLHRHKVPYVATLICGGDVGGLRAQRTEVQDYLFTEERTKQPVPRVHYRICTKEIGLPLTEFANFRELAFIFVDAIKGTYPTIVK